MFPATSFQPVRHGTAATASGPRGSDLPPTAGNTLITWDDGKGPERGTQEQETHEMRPWSSAKGWTPRDTDHYRLDPAADDLATYEPVRRNRIDLAIWRWVLIPAITVAILATAAYFATFAARADEWLCTGSSICFDRAGIVYSNTDPGQMLVRAQDIKTGDRGWIAVDCVARLAIADSPMFAIQPGSPLDKLCDTIGRDE